MLVSRSLMWILVSMSALWGLTGTAGSFAAEPVTATGYFVDCKAGNDSNSGTSHSAPWLTLGKANSAITKTGSDLWLKSDTVCEDQRLIVDWSGTTADHAIVGTYYVSGGVAYQNSPDSVSGPPVKYA
jgi:hypothetical protein